MEFHSDDDREACVMSPTSGREGHAARVAAVPMHTMAQDRTVCKLYSYN